VHRCEHTFPALAEHVRDARREVSDFARRFGVPESELDGVRLAVSEAVGNAVMHGYRDGNPGGVTVIAEADDHRLRVLVRDDGCGMSPNVDSRGAGLGLPLIAELAESMSVRTTATGRGTQLCMTFGLSVSVDA
jgi:stage II sporulation protein AB (anti-sigma F factor)